MRLRLLCTLLTIDLVPTDVEVYGKKKRGVAFNYAGERCGRPHPALYAEAGMVLGADLGSGTDDPRPQAPSLIARAVRTCTSARASASDHPRRLGVL